MGRSPLRSGFRKEQSNAELVTVVRLFIRKRREYGPTHVLRSDRFCTGVQPPSAMQRLCVQCGRAARQSPWLLRICWRRDGRRWSSVTVVRRHKPFERKRGSDKDAQRLPCSFDGYSRTAWSPSTSGGKLTTVEFRLAVASSMGRRHLDVRRDHVRLAICSKMSAIIMSLHRGC